MAAPASGRKPPFKAKQGDRCFTASCFILFGLWLYLTTFVLAVVVRLVPGNPLGQFLHATLWYSGLPRELHGS